ncbi:hypothetical protein [Aquimarina sp. MMG016]|uniref:hypothetical protein n=1 Tax=Aquimarina sp. MMG016 TaxID=2822690 RepID=UPI001B3A1A6A|nr:hypothetical protein [Aquimarina sp. MMG016]MBQ4821895.1 hypothetical protein [Aquimarina sp. MMG016]
MKIYFLVLVAIAITFLSSCSSNDDASVENKPKLIVKLAVDPNQVRLGNDGSQTDIEAGNAGQNPVFNSISAHYLELAPNASTFLGQGTILYQAPETDTGGATAIDFDQSNIVAPGETFLEIPLKDIQAGSYEWVRLSLSYQNYDVTFHFNDAPFTGTVASFVGFNTYITDYTVKNEQVTVNDNKLQGYWGFETITGVQTGQAPEGATTVPNPLFNTSPIPQGSCVVTGSFDTNLVITGEETEDIVVTLSLSINKSFEWIDTNGNDKWDVNPGTEESIVDMGLRGLVPSYE